MTGQFIVLSASAVSTQSATPSNVSVTGPINVTNRVTNITIVNSANVTRQSTPYAPGFEGIFAITGLLAAAYLVFGRKH